MAKNLIYEQHTKPNRRRHRFQEQKQQLVKSISSTNCTQSIIRDSSNNMMNIDPLVEERLFSDDDSLPNRISSSSSNVINQCTTTKTATTMRMINKVRSRQHCKVRLTQSCSYTKTKLSTNRRRLSQIIFNSALSTSFLLSMLLLLFCCCCCGLLTKVISPMNLILLAEALPNQNVATSQPLTLQPINANNNNNQQQHSVIQTTSATLSSSSSSSVLPSGSTSKARYKTMYACEDRQLVMDCEYGSKINLIRANFGRFSITQCNEQGQLDLSTDCMSPLTFRMMKERCQDRQRCSVNATSSIFGDKCPNTRKYLEVHFQCQPASEMLYQQQQNLERVDVRQQQQQPQSIINMSNDNMNNNKNDQPISPQMMPPFIGTVTTGGSSPILPPNNPHPNVIAPPPRSAHNDNVFDHHTRASSSIGLQQQQQQQYPKPQSVPVINSEVVNYQQLLSPAANNSPQDKFVVPLRHLYENLSNPRCQSWDPISSQWTDRGGSIISTNQTHTICEFDQASSYVLVMDFMNTSSISPSVMPSPLLQPQPQPQSIQQQQHQQQQQQQQHQPQQLSTPQIDIREPYPGILDLKPTDLDHQQLQSVDKILVANANGQQHHHQHQQQQQSPMGRFMTLVGYMFVCVFIAAICLMLVFIVSALRSSSSAASAALKSLGNFAAFGGVSGSGKTAAARRNAAAEAALRSKDLLVINSQNGHQFLYAPASTTKISNSSSTHILTTGSHHQVGTLHQLQQQQQQQQQVYNNTLSSLSAAGPPSHNYYYGLTGLTSLFQQQQQQQHHMSQHHLNQQQQQQQQVPPANSYHHQANKSTISNESNSNSSASSSGVESGSPSVQQPQTQQACLLVNNNDFNLMGGNASTGNYGQLGQQQQQNLLANWSQQPTLVTLNAHYGSNNNGQQMRQLQNVSQSMREHIYECVDDHERPYAAARLLLAPQHQQPDQFGTLGHQQQQHLNGFQQQQQLNNNAARTMTLSSRMMQQQQPIQPQSQSPSNKRQFQQPAIVRDSQPSAKTNIICSKMAQVTPQRATEVGNLAFLHQDVMAIYNGSDTTTTTTASNNIAQQQQQQYGRLGSSNVNGGAKLSTDC